MPLVAAKCTKCGGVLQIDNAQEAAICPYCGTPFIVEKAVNYYTTQNVTNIGSVEHADIHMEDSRGLETRLKNAESYLVQHKDYEKAEELFKAITGEFAGDWRGWWGAVRAMTHEFEGIPAEIGYDYPRTFNYSETTVEGLRDTLKSAFAVGEVQKMGERAFHVMDEENEAKLRPVWSDFQQRSLAYIADYVDRVSQDYAAKKKVKDQFHARAEEKENASRQLRNESSDCRQRARKLKSQLSNGGFFYIFAGIPLGVGAIALSRPTGWAWLALVGLVLLVLGVIHVCYWVSSKSGNAKSKRLDDQATQEYRQIHDLRNQEEAQLGEAYASYPVQFEPFYTM